VRALFDTSVLVPVFLEDHEHHERSLQAFLGADRRRDCCAAHSLAEVYSAMTRLPPALIEYWRGRLRKAERLIFEALADAYPDALTKEEVAARAGYKANGGGFNNALGRLRTLELVQGRGELRASNDLFISATP